MNQALLEREKSRLLKMRSRLISSVDNTEQAIREDVRSPGDLSNLPTHLGNEDEEGVDAHVEIATNQEAMLEQVEAALERVEKGAYGRCENCGQEISVERLEALPFHPLLHPLRVVARIVLMSPREVLE